ncbi:MAG: DUF6516 family protein [Actinomycetia bacterium]|nr:DUF6516 family protein [Actinomycetes bacterium]
MPLSAYLAEIHRLLAATPCVTRVDLTSEDRPPSALYLSGTICFTDSSQLDFKEFAVATPSPCVLKYAYHYHMSGVLRFRYDNAADPAARHLPTYPHHRHGPDGLAAAQPPTLATVLTEILARLVP